MVKNLRIYSNSVINKLTIHKLITLLKKELNFTIDNLEINFINSTEIIKANRKYLNHNYSTDIITFNYSSSKSSLDGEILISIEDAFDNSKRFKISIKEELLRLVIHGVLHLLGFKDENKNDKKIMKIRENFLLHKYKFLVQEL